MEQYFVPVPILCGTRDSSRAAHPTSRDSRQPPAKRDPTADSHTPYGSSGSRPLVDHHHRWWQARVHSTAATLPPLPPLAPSHCLVGAHRGSIGPPDTVTCRRRHSGWWWSVQDTQPRGRRARRLLSDGELSPRSSFRPAPSHPPHVLEADDEGQCPRWRVKSIGDPTFLVGPRPPTCVGAAKEGGEGKKKDEKGSAWKITLQKKTRPPPARFAHHASTRAAVAPRRGEGTRAKARALARSAVSSRRWGGGGWVGVSGHLLWGVRPLPGLGGGGGAPTGTNPWLGNRPVRSPPTPPQDRARTGGAGADRRRRLPPRPHQDLVSRPARFRRVSTPSRDSRGEGVWGWVGAGPPPPPGPAVTPHPRSGTCAPTSLFSASALGCGRLAPLAAVWQIDEHPLLLSWPSFCCSFP